LIVVLEIALLQDLILLPGPRVLLQMGIKVVAIAFPQIFALGSWEDGGELIPAQFATILIAIMIIRAISKRSSVSLFLRGSKLYHIPKLL
jgi:hypothetical protein